MNKQKMVTIHDITQIKLTKVMEVRKSEFGTTFARSIVIDYQDNDKEKRIEIELFSIYKNDLTLLYE